MRCGLASKIRRLRRRGRGVIKTKLNTKRCLPLMARTEDCAICVKVCPIRRYGAGAVMDSGDELKTR
jgi:epoxyqueuosine reductase